MATSPASQQRPSRPRVRPFRPDDAAQASVVMIEAFRSFLPRRNRQLVLDGFAPEALRATSTADQPDATAACYVAVDQGQIVGYVRGSVNAYGCGTLGVIGVHPQAFQRGVGSLLLRRMMTFWRDRGMRKVTTCVSAHNRRALCFYLKHGFTPVGYQRDHFLEGMDEVLLDLFLK